MPISQFQMLALLENDLIHQKIFPMLDEKSLCLFSRTSKEYQALSVMTRKSAELLFCVLNPNETNLKRMEALLSAPQAEVQSIILIRVSGQEVYFSKQQNKILPRPNRMFHTMSPLEAAFRCGDFPLVQRLVDRVPGNQKAQALEQLQKVRAKCSENEPGSYLYDLASLRKAYKGLPELYRTLEAARNWDEIARLSGHLGEAQKNLSWFLLQVFCNPVPHHPIPNFIKEPMRACLLWDNSEFSLDSIGLVSCLALYKGESRGVWLAPATLDIVFATAAEATVRPNRCSLDSLAIDRLCEVLTSELDKIIKMLIDAAPNNTTSNNINPHSSFANSRVSSMSSSFSEPSGREQPRSTCQSTPAYSLPPHDGDNDEKQRPEAERGEQPKRQRLS